MTSMTVRCQCPLLAGGNPCQRLATQEDLLCDVCRENGFCRTVRRLLAEKA
jgi:hypothetical protein